MRPHVATNAQAHRHGWPVASDLQTAVARPRSVQHPWALNLRWLVRNDTAYQSDQKNNKSDNGWAD